MENIKTEIKGNLLVITIDASKDLGASKSGKTRMVATSAGNQKITVGTREVYLGVNCYTK